MNKVYLSADALLLDAYRLARQVFESGFEPDFLVGVWRGGAPVGIAMQEFLAYLGRDTDHIAIRAASYTGIAQQQAAVRVDGLEYLAERARPDHRVLLVDDVFDSGRSMRAILEALAVACGDRLPASIRIACPWYKPEMNATDRAPDYYLHETSDWLVFPHELRGLSLEEIRQNKGEVAELLAQSATEPG